MTRAPSVAGPPPAEPQAVVIARRLQARLGASALGTARRRGRVAHGRGQIGRADLYRAVCAILGAHHDVYARLRRSAGAVAAPSCKIDRPAPYRGC